MQKLFVTFPDGPPGFGLLLMRLAASAGLVAVAARIGPWIGLLVAAVLALPLLIGLMTTVAALAAVGLETAIALSGDLYAPLLQAATIAQLLGLALVGPGAYSLDARLFGRRRLIFESRRSEDPD